MQTRLGMIRQIRQGLNEFNRWFEVRIAKREIENLISSKLCTQPIPLFKHPPNPGGGFQTPLHLLIENPQRTTPRKTPTRRRRKIRSQASIILSEIKVAKRRGPKAELTRMRIQTRRHRSTYSRGPDDSTSVGFQGQTCLSVAPRRL